MSIKLKSKVSAFLLVLQFLFSFILPLQPLVSLAQAQESEVITFSKKESSVLVLNSQASDAIYFFQSNNTIHASKAEIANGTFKLNLKSQSGEDELIFDAKRLVLKTDLNSYFLEIAEKEVRVLQEYQSDSLDLSSEEQNFLMNSWQTNSAIRMSTTDSDVVLNQEYRFPLNEDVRVTFTRLPAKSSPLSIQEVQLSLVQQKALGTTASIAYDVTTAMQAGEFAFDLSLPSISNENKDISVKFAENISQLSNAETAQNELTISDESVTIKNLDHMTIFVVIDDGDVNYTDNSWNNYTSSGYSGDVHWVTPSQTDKVATWTFNGAAGKYAILPSWIIWTDHATNAHYTSSNIPGFDLSGVNQKIVANASVVGSANGLWSGWYVNSGRYDLNPGNTVTLSVEVGGSATNGNLTADAIAFVGMSDIYVDDDWTGNLVGKDLGSGKIFGVNAFATVQEGINAVSVGGTVNVANGTYVEVGQIIINKTLSIVGEDKVNTIIKPGQDTGSSGDSRGWILVNSGVNFTLQNTTLDGDGKLVSIGILSHGPGSIENNIIKNMGFNPSGPDYAGRAVAFYDSNLTIKNNLVQNFGRIGIYTYGPGDALIENNVIEGKGIGDHLDYGVEVEGGSSAVIKGNTISAARGVASADGSISAGILATTYFASGTTLKIINNSIQDNAYGIALGYNNDTTSVTQFDGNTFFNNNYDLDNYTLINVDARNNTWSVIDQNDLNQIEAKINHYCSGSNYIHGICSGSDDYSSGFGVVRYKNIATPTNLGWNVSSKSITPNETPLDFSCSISSSYTNENSVAQNWSAISGVGIKYQRQVTYPSSAIGYFNAGNLAYTPFSSFGSGPGIEGLWKTKVRSYVDANNNNVLDSGEETSDWSNECNITYDKTAPAKPTLVSPAHNALVSGNPTQNWTSVSGVHHYLYQSADNNGFSPLIYSTSLSGTSRTVSGNQTIGFWWRVRAVDAAGNEGPWSDAWFLNVDNTAPAKPTLVSPVDDAQVKGATLTNDWGDVLGAVKYIYESYNNSTATSLRFSAEYSPSQKTATNVADTQFWWRVKAIDAVGNQSSWSDLWHLTVDNTAPVLAGKTSFSGWYAADQLSEFTFTDAVDSSLSGLPVSCTINNEGLAQTCSVTPNVCDEAGNCYTSELTSNGVNIDKTDPTSLITAPSNDGSNSVVYINTWDGVISGTAADSLSGLASVELSIQRTSDGKFFDGSNWTGETEATRVPATGTSSWSYDLGEVPEDSYQIISHAIDNAGNVEDSYELTIVFDKTIPEVKLSINPTLPDGRNGWYETQPTITLMMTDDKKTDHIAYQWQNQTGAWTTYTGPIQPSSEGNHAFYYKAIDQAGNSSAVGVKNVAWDKTQLTDAPLKVDATPDRSGGPNAKVTWEAATDNVGIDHYKVTFDLLNGDADFSEDVASHIRELSTARLQEQGTWKVTVTAYDGAGHEKSASDDIVVDRTTSNSIIPEAAVQGGGQVGPALNQEADVLGVDTEDQAVSETPVAENGQVQGASTSCNDLVNSLWWILLLLQFAALFMVEYKLSNKQKWLKIGMYVLLAVLPFVLTSYLVNATCFANGFTSWMLRYYFVPVLAMAMLAKVASYLLIEDESN